MGAKSAATATALMDDEFDSYLENAQRDPAFRAAHEDANDLQRLLDTLVQLRRLLGLSQTEIAHRMGVRQPTVSGFETEGSDPRLSTLQRYARAVSARLRLRVDVPRTCDWIDNAQSAYSSARQPFVEPEPPRTVEKTSLPHEWDRPRYRRGHAA